MLGGGGMLGVGIALVLLGILTLFLIPWVGIAAGVLGVLLLIVYAVGAARRPAEPPR